MSIRVRHRTYVQISRDTDGKKKLFYPDSNLEEVVTDGFDRHVSGGLSIAAAATEALSMGDVTDPRGILLEVSAACRVYLDGGSEFITLSAPPSPTPEAAGIKLFLEADITSVSIENTSGATLTGVYCVWGDPTP